LQEKKSGHLRPKSANSRKTGLIRWTTVRYDEAMKKPVFGDEFRVANAVAY
jgi:hypothetical protein